MNDIFNIPDSDLSLQMLYYLFNPLLEIILGTNAVSGPSLYSTAIAAGFGIFNSSVIFLGAVYVFIHAVSAVLKTAHEGVILGRQWSTMWVPLRLGLGFAVLLPLNAGYSVLQAGVLWFAVQGVGLGNSMFSGVLDVIVKPADISMVAQAPSAYDIAKDVYMAASCNYYVNEAIEIQGNSFGLLEGRPDFGITRNENTPGEVYVLAATAANPVAGFAASNRATDYRGLKYVIDYDFGNLKLTGGSILNSAKNTFEKVTDFFGGNDDVNVSESTADAARGDGRGGRESLHASNACGELTIEVDAISSAANGAISGVFSSEHLDQLHEVQSEFMAIYKVALDKFVTDMDALVKKVHGSSSSAVGSAAVAANFYAVTDDFDSAINQWLTAQAGREIPQTVWQSFISDMKKDGWISGPSIYYSMVSINERYNELANISPTSTAYNGLNQDKADSKITLFAEYVDPKMVQAEALYHTWNTHVSNDINENGMLTPKNIVRGAQVATDAGGAEGTDGYFMKELNKKMSTALDDVLNNMRNAIIVTGAESSERVQFINGARAPILVAQNYGKAILTGVSVIFLSMLVMGLASGNIFSNAAGGATVFSSVVMPFVFLALGALMFFGLTLAYYIPLVPFIIGMGAVLSWLVAVAETMIVANIWGVTFLSPEDEGFIGKRAEAGFLLILGVFLRPVLILFGLFLAAAISFVLFAYINSVFWSVFDQTSTGGLNWFLSVYAFLAGVAIYTIFTLTTMSSIYSLIHRVPDNVLRVLGGGQEPLGDMGAERDSKAAFAGFISSGQAATQGSLSYGTLKAVGKKDGEKGTEPGQK